MMYDELIKRLREAAEYIPCIMDREDAIKAADAIEELQAQIDGWIEQERNALLKSIPKWIPVTARPMDEEERKEWSEKRGYDIEYDEALIYTSQLPDDGQEVLVCGRYGGRWIDRFEDDPDYGCCFAENGDMDRIEAWMPLPEPYKEERKDDE